MKTGGWSRRHFVRSLVAAPAAWMVLPSCGREEERAREDTSPASVFPERLGVQLYTLRHVLPEDPRGVLERVAAIGYKEVEVLRRGLAELMPLLREFSLEAVSGHFETPLVTGNWEPWAGAIQGSIPEGYDWKAAVQEAASYRLRYMVIPYLMPAERGGEEEYRRFCGQLNEAGRISKEQGIQLCYHHHDFELAPLGESTSLEIMMQELDPQLVALELDVFWCQIAGQDPVQWIRRYPGRIPLVHLKDLAPGTPRSLGQSPVPPEAFKEVGNGVVDFPAVLQVARESGVRHFLVEQDHTPGDPVESLRTSYQYLRGLRV